MVDMHIHSTYSDGDKSIEEILIECEKLKLDYISITDHHNMKQYEDEAFNKNIFSGKIIKGAEMNSFIGNKRIEFLGYNLKKPEMINEYFDKFYSTEILKQKQEHDRKVLFEMCKRNNLVYNKNFETKEIPLTGFVMVELYYELIKHEENIKILGEYAKSFNDFWSLPFENPNSSFYLGPNLFPKPNYKEVANIIHEAGGLVFLAHPFEYKFEDTFEFIDNLRKEIKLDGIECFHPYGTGDNKIEELLEYAKKNNLYISGGSDYHGTKKPNIKIGIGDGTLNISKEYIEEWYNN